MISTGTHPHTFATLRPLLLLLLLVPLLAGCGIQRAVTRSAMAPVVDGGFEAMMAEDDLELARPSLAANVKLLEGMVRADPAHLRLRLLAAQGLTAFALGWVEQEDEERARALYLRGRDHALAWLAETTGRDLSAINRFRDFEAAVEELEEEAVPGLFWAGNAWASALMLSLQEMEAVAQLPRVEAMMRRVLELDSTYWHGGAHLFFGGYYGARPPMLGGSPEKAERHLRAQIELTGGEMLLGRLFLVQYIHLPALNGEAAREELEQILAYDVRKGPEELRLLNALAQKRAGTLLEELDEKL